MSRNFPPRFHRLTLFAAAIALATGGSLVRAQDCTPENLVGEPQSFSTGSSPKAIETGDPVDFGELFL